MPRTAASAIDIENFGRMAALDHSDSIVLRHLKRPRSGGIALAFSINESDSHARNASLDHPPRSLAGDGADAAQASL
jgi:hypothetical protein